MRRILYRIVAGDTSNLGDTSTLANPGVVEKLLKEKQAIAVPSQLTIAGCTSGNKSETIYRPDKTRQRCIRRWLSDAA